MTIIAETERLLIRQLEDIDEADLYAVGSDPDVAHYMDDGTPLTAEQAHAWIGISKLNYQKAGHGNFAIVLKKNNEFIGFGGLVHPGGAPQIEIIYGFKKAYWGQGFATEFVQQMVEVGFARWKFAHIEASIHIDNKASIHVVEKAGMTFLRQEIDEDGEPIVYYGINNPTLVV